MMADTACQSRETSWPDHPALVEPSPTVTTRKRALSGLRESDDAYTALVEFEGTRVINCRDDIQWILQRRMPSRWLSVGYFRNRDVLIERSGAKRNALTILRALPEMHP
jgi:hypothetical protein